MHSQPAACEILIPFRGNPPVGGHGGCFDLLKIVGQVGFDHNLFVAGLRMVDPSEIAVKPFLNVTHHAVVLGGVHIPELGQGGAAVFDKIPIGRHCLVGCHFVHNIGTPVFAEHHKHLAQADFTGGEVPAAALDVGDEVVEHPVNLVVRHKPCKERAGVARLAA